MLPIIVYMTVLSLEGVYTSNESWNHQIYVDWNEGVDDKSCLKGSIDSPCATINMALKGLINNSTVLYIINPGVYMLKPGNEIHIQNKSQIAIFGSGDNTTIICDPLAGLQISWTFNVTLESITLQGCGLHVSHRHYKSFYDRHINFHFQAALSINRSHNVILRNVKAHYSNGTGLLLIDVSGNLNFKNVSIHGSKFIHSSFSSKEGVLIGGGMILYTGRQYKYILSMFTSTISNNNFEMLESNTSDSDCSPYTFGGITLLFYEDSPGLIVLDSCSIVNNSRGFVTYGLDHFWFNVEIRNSVVNNHDYSALYAISYWYRSQGSLFEFIQVNMTDNLLVFSDLQSQHPINYINFYNEYKIISSWLIISVNSLGLNNHSNPSVSFQNSSMNCMHDNCYINYINDKFCGDGLGVAINSHNLSCVECKSSIIGLVALIGLEFVPVTVMVGLIAVLNVNLNQGSLSSYIFFCQLLTTSFPSVGYPSWIVPKHAVCQGIHNDQYQYDLVLLLSPLSIWNLDFINFLYNDINGKGISICISEKTTPLGAISFWYLIALYPLVLIVLMYVCVNMYGKGYKCFICALRPIHRVLARFWRMFDIQPSLVHTAASMYTLCFTQLAAISFKILYSNNNPTEPVFFYDYRQKYFRGWHGLAGTFAIVVLVLLITATMYLLLYPFRLFQKCISSAKINKDLLISLSDALTGPYKDGTENTWDYRYFVGIHFAVRLVVMVFYYIPLKYGFGIYILETVICIFMFSAVVIFRPYKKNIHSFTEALFLVSLGALCWSSFAGSSGSYIMIMQIVCPVVLILAAYCLIWMIKKCEYGLNYVHSFIPQASQSNQNTEPPTETADGDNIMFADRIMNPQFYDKENIPVNEQ